MKLGISELKTLATAGISARVKEIEKELATYHEGWPELFLSSTVPQILKAEQSKNGHSSIPRIVARRKNARWTPERRARFLATVKKKQEAIAQKKNKQRASWTPERRALMAKLMKKRSKAMWAAKKG